MSPMADEEYSGLRGIAPSIVGKVEIHLEENSVTEIYFSFFLHVLETFFFERRTNAF